MIDSIWSPNLDNNKHNQDMKLEIFDIFLVFFVYILNYDDAEIMMRRS